MFYIKYQTMHKVQMHASSKLFEIYHILVRLYRRYVLSSRIDAQAKQ